MIYRIIRNDKMRRTTSFNTFPKTNMWSKHNVRNICIYINIKHTTKRFLLILIPHDEGVSNDVYQDIYPPELQLKIGHPGTHATFLNLEITVKDGMVILKVFNKCDALPFIIARMPYIDNNIPKPIIYSALSLKFLRKSRSSLLTKTLMKMLWNCLIEWKHQGHIPLGVEKHHLNFFKGMEKCLLILEKIMIKFFNFKFYYLMHDTLPAALSFCYIYFSCITLCQQCSHFLDMTHCQQFSFLWHMRIS